jgi:hypothetical protein
MNLEQKLSQVSQKKPKSRPVFFDLSKTAEVKKLEALLDSGKIVNVVNDYEEQLKELFAIENPGNIFSPDFGKMFEAHKAKLEADASLARHGKWVFFPWSGTLVHILDEPSYYLVRTARNKYLIEPDEQDKFYNTVVGVAGLSVGSSIAIAIALGGGARHIKLADSDRLALSNTNRILSGIENLGLKKTDTVARQIYALNPYAEIELFPDGLTKENLPAFFDGLDILVDEIDSFEIKFLLRKEAKRRKIPVIAAIDNEESSLVDIERYDTNPKTDFFNARLGEVSEKRFSRMTKLEVGQTIATLVGPENSTKKMHKSLGEIGKTIVSWPQLGGTALMNGAVAAYCVRKLINGERLNNRAIISLDEKLLDGYNSKKERNERQKAVKTFKKMLGLS